MIDIHEPGIRKITSVVQLGQPCAKFHYWQRSKALYVIDNNMVTFRWC
jgi:hypothetical protein